MAKEPISQFMAHWQPLMSMISLVQPLHLRKAMQEWVNKNQNCAYSMKSGSCDMNCESCLNDITIEHIVHIEKKSKELQKDIMTKGVKNEKRMSKMSKS